MTSLNSLIGVASFQTIVANCSKLSDVEQKLEYSFKKENYDFTYDPERTTYKVLIDGKELSVVIFLYKTKYIVQYVDFAGKMRPVYLTLSKVFL